MSRKKVKETKEESVEDKKDVDLARSALLEAVETFGEANCNDDSPTYSARPFLRLFASGNSGIQLREGLSLRDQKNLLFRAIQGFPKPLARRFFATLDEISKSVISSEAYLPESAYQDDDIDNLEDDSTSSTMEVTRDAGSSENLQFLNYATLCVKAYLDGQIEKHAEKQAAKLSIIDEAFQLTQALHDILFLLNSGGPDAVEPQANIVLLCETCWINNCEYKELVVLQALPLIVYSAIHEETKSSVKRLFDMRKAIAEIDFGSSSSQELKAMLLRLASSPKILKLSEGKKILSYLMQIDMHLLQGLHMAIRAQIPDLRSPLLLAFGECYFRAWKDAPSPEIRDAIETHVLYDLMNTAINIARPNLSKSLLVVLEPFHSEKKTPEVEKLLHRMYSGILWRALSTSNGKIRVNATHVFTQVFPLRDSSTMQTEQSIRKGCDALETLLQDPDPKVRAAASQAAAHILRTYWDVLPPKEIRELLNFIVMDHVSDRPSAAVRSAAVDAITNILEAPQSHGVLRTLLPLVGNLIHDRVEKVRLAVVRMLLKIKAIPGIKYYHVVPVSHLTCRLAAEGRVNVKGQVASALTGLMVNSFCPHGPNVSSRVQVTRTLKFLKNDSVAASVFYSNLSQHVPVSFVATLAANLFRCVHSAVEIESGETSQVRKGNRLADGEDSENETTSTDRPLLSATDTALMTNLVETVSTLWQSIQSRLQQPVHETSRDVLVKSFSETALLDVLSYFESRSQESMETDDKVDDNFNLENLCHRATASLLSCAGRLPAESTEGLVPRILNVLSSLSEEESPRAINVTSHIALLCSRNMTDDVALSLAASIESSFEQDYTLNFDSPDAGSRKRKSSRNGSKSKNPVVPGIPPRVALQVLSDLLKSCHPTSVSARRLIFSSQTACVAIERALIRGTKYAERILQSNGNRAYATNVSEFEIEYILQLCEAYGRYALHKEALSNDDDYTSGGQATNLLQWTTTVVLPLLVSSQKVEQAPFIDPDLSRISFAKSLDGLPTSPVPTGPPRRRSNRNARPVRLDMNDDSTFASLASPQSSSSQPLEISRDLAFSLMHSCLILFSEMKALGVADIDGISESACHWTIVFDEADYDVRHKALLFAFCRLAFSLCKNSSSFALLQSLIVKSQEHEDDRETSPVAAVVSKLLSVRGQNVTVADIVQCVLEAIHTVLSNGVIVIPELPASLGDLWPEDKGCVRSTLKAVLSSKVGSLELARRIVSSFENHQDVGLSALTFYAKCLYLLCDAETTRAAPEIVHVARGLDVGALDAPAVLKTVLEELQVGLA